MAWPAKAAQRPTVMRDGTKVGEGMTMEGGGGGWRDAGHDRHSLALLLVACNVTTPYLGVPRWRRGGGLVDWQRSKTWVARLGTLGFRDGSGGGGLVGVGPRKELDRDG